MKIGLDSATPPTAGQVAAAKAAGIAVWSGYLATKPGVRLLRPWSQAEFTVVKTLPGVPIAFYSGWDDPVACKALAAAWGVRLCLDVEEGIRGDGPWVQANLDASGGGLYSYASAFPNRRMAFAILADRSRTPPDPNATWAAWHPRPGVPCGWQWQGSHNEFGVTVDRNWLDDWFGGDDMNQQQNDWLASIVTALGLGTTDQSKWPNYPARLSAIEAELAALKAATGAPGKPAAPFDATITPK